MDLTNVLTMDKNDAADKAAQYRTIKAPSEEDRRIAAIFAALASGKQVIDVEAAVRDAGRDEKGFPVLAFGPVKAPWCHLQSWSFGARFYASPSGRGAPSLSVENWPGGGHAYVSSWNCDHRTQTPIVPPEHRVWGHKSMSILWEVEEWAKSPRPPGDPILCKRLLGNLYTVEAHWDLTDVERLVLAQRP